jgi:drug/metabolite transporter superfamily protein YnfA
MEHAHPTLETIWSASLVAHVLALFVLAALAEIGGGFLVWQTMREAKPWYHAALGALVLVLYGFIPPLQPISDFGRTYAVYGKNAVPPSPCADQVAHARQMPPTFSPGGFFIGLSFLWGWIFEGMRPDKGDVIGSVLSCLGVCVCLFWPREHARESGEGSGASHPAPML